MARRPGADPTVRHGHGKGGGMRRLRKLLSGAVGIAALAASGVAMVHAYSEGRSSASGGPPVLIKADPGPFKVKPDSPGGRAVPDRDKRIYDRVAAAPQKRTPERLLPPRKSRCRVPGTNRNRPRSRSPRFPTRNRRNPKRQARRRIRRRRRRRRKPGNRPPRFRRRRNTGCSSPRSVRKPASTRRGSDSGRATAISSPVSDSR